MNGDITLEAFRPCQRASKEWPWKAGHDGPNFSGVSPHVSLYRLTNSDQIRHSNGVSHTPHPKGGVPRYQFVGPLRTPIPVTRRATKFGTITRLVGACS